MITKKNRQLVDTVGMWAFLFLFMAVASVEIAKTQSMNVALANNVSYPWMTPILNEGVLPAYGCKQRYKLPPVWVCDWRGEQGKMQTNVYITPNITSEYPTDEEWANESSKLPQLQTGK
jgi:hypothetical protein|tara:strand:+ start:2272 stop:2628 length:357 start_codon:yes stop_codon:yes gene_type:complete